MTPKEVKYIWSWPIRLTHWFTFLSVLVLSVTGYYIAFPPAFIAPKGEPFENFLMSQIRFLHFLSAVVLIICFLVATYLIFYYKFHVLWRDIRPTPSNMKLAWKSIKYYLGFSKVHQRYDFLDPMAMLSILSYTLLGLILIFTGIALYSIPRAGTGLGLSLLQFLSAWTVPLFGSLQGIRVAHHFSMWLLLGWFTIHLYFQIWKSVRLKQYDISAIIGGYKYFDTGEKS